VGFRVYASTHAHGCNFCPSVASCCHKETREYVLPTSDISSCTSIPSIRVDINFSCALRKSLNKPTVPNHVTNKKIFRNVSIVSFIYHIWQLQKDTWTMARPWTNLKKDWSWSTIYIFLRQKQSNSWSKLGIYNFLWTETKVKNTFTIPSIKLYLACQNKIRSVIKVNISFHHYIQKNEVSRQTWCIVSTYINKQF
jgi:hypothetical protein